MLHDELLPSLITALMGATCFENAATAVLKAMLACAQDALAETPYANAGRLLRGMVHLRSEGSYQCLFGIDHRSDARASSPGYLTSANVWRWVAEHRCSVAIDVQLGVLRPFLPNISLERRENRDADGLPGDATRERMLGRDATHVHVVPLRMPGRGVTGMISLEASCKAAIGKMFVWDECHEALELLACVAAPYLASLPAQPTPAKPGDELLPVVGASSAALIDLLRVFARQEETVLISGPTGSGKSRLARWCHVQSPRKEQPFETLDLLSVPEELQMAELFGWKRGAFTGAVKDAPGAVVRAAQGTLFIDEIDKLSLKAQAGLLRLLEERRYRPLGQEGAEQQADVRFIIGTNADLRASVRAGRFREDLYYRINVLPVRLPTLGERLDELPLWSNYMLIRRHRETGGRGTAHVAPDALEVLLSVSWPGNLRQLDNIVRRAYALATAENADATMELVLQRHHVHRALAYESGETRALLEQLWRAAQTYVIEADRLKDSATPLKLEHCEAFRGLVLGAAAARQGSREDAFILLGEEAKIQNRNHHRQWKREIDRVRDLMHLVGGDADRNLAALLDAKDEPSETR